MTAFKTELPAFVTDYFDLMDAKPHRFCKEQWLLRTIITEVFRFEELTIDQEQYEHYLGLGKYLGFGKGYVWERFLTGLFLCTYTLADDPRWDEILVYVGRGAGKSGLIAWWALCLISPYNPIPDYDVDIGAYNEDQALRPVKDVRKALNRYETKMKKFFKWTLEVIVGKQNGGELKGYANNSKGLDGLRPGIVMLDEVHAYENNKTLEVFTSAMGKHKHPRIAYFTTEGYVQDGPLDDFMRQAHKELDDQDASTTTLWYICKLDNEEEVHDEENWHKANPSLADKPELMKVLRTRYKKWKISPGNNLDFICKRMNIKKSRDEVAVTTRENLMATEFVQLDEKALEGRECTIGIDFSKTTDWTGVNIHFRDGDIRQDICHGWICKQGKDFWRLKCPYEEWEAAGLVTIVDQPEISPKLIADYIADACEKYSVKAVALDDYRYQLVAEQLEPLGFSKANKNLFRVRPTDIMRIVPVIDRCFAMHFFSWGVNPMLRWCTNNTTLVPTKKSVLAKSGEIQNGNFLLGKIEPKARKNDPFMALVASMVIEDKISPDAVPVDLDEEGTWTF